MEKEQVPEGSKCEGIFSTGVSPIIITSTNFDLDIFVRDHDLDVEFLDSLLMKLPSSEVERVMKEHMPKPSK